ncbi:MAG TPA: class I SAM-dependent methyltransferase [Solirubrobacteraceae bacterium]|jgi:SAM-dependent methyltransferase|nr:class I SAM-dependent methyltransferase [Solirubrobacteraceae bacterium]
MPTVIPDSYADVVAAYDGVESLERFSATQLRAYRDDLLARTVQQASFVASLLPARARLLELGSGNGRLPIALALADAIADATGFEVAESRVAFARAWAADAGLANVRFDSADVLDVALPGELDAVVCITGAFAYFDAMRAGSAGELLRRVHGALRHGGVLVLELYPHPRWRRLLTADGSHELRLWQELPASDPWRFYLSDLRYDAERRVLSHRKTFVHRTSGEIDDSRREHLRLYDADELDAELRAAGFVDVRAHGDWTGRAPAPDDELLVVCARRP